jgi:inhibitor of cysteine peptidase
MTGAVIQVLVLFIFVIGTEAATRLVRPYRRAGSSPHCASAVMASTLLKAVKSMDLSYRDSGRTLDLRTGQTIRIELAENPTTGYRWQTAQSGEPVLEPAGDSFRRGSSPGLGAGGTRTLDFRVNSPGTATLRLLYQRSGESDSTRKEFVLHLHATD